MPFTITIEINGRPIAEVAGRNLQRVLPDGRHVYSYSYRRRTASGVPRLTLEREVAHRPEDGIEALASHILEDVGRENRKQI